MLDLTRLLLLCSLSAAVGCGASDKDDDDDGNDDSGDVLALECAEPAYTVCGNDASVVRGHISLGDQIEGVSTKGNLFIALTHDAYSASLGGGYHTSTVVREVDLADGPVEFSLDMCEGSAMWSEENCDYGLVVILDQDSDQHSGNLLPDVGEPATRYGPIVLSCDGESPCLDIRLDCLDGESCVQFTSPSECACSEDSCGSTYAICG